MNEYVNVHFALEALRQRSAQQAQTQAGAYQAAQGPRTLILGPAHSGKTSLAKLLTAYAIRSARQPVVVNLDSAEGGMLSLPGTLTTAAFKTIMDVEDTVGPGGWGSSPMSGPSAVPVKVPLVYYYGLESPEAGDSGKGYVKLTSRLALAVAGRLKDDGEVRDAGVIIDTPGSLTSTKAGSTTGYEIIAHIVSEFAVSNIVVLGSERLYSEMARRFDGKPIGGAGRGISGEKVAVVKLPKSGGCVDRDDAYMRAQRAAQVKAYFYGSPQGPALSPRQQQVDWGNLSVFCLKGGAANTSGGPGGESLAFLPGGVEDDETVDDPAGNMANATTTPGGSGRVLERMSKPLGAMRNCVLAVMNADPEAEEEEVRESSVMGFLYVVDVDEAKGRINLLAPVAGRIPNRAIVWGVWPEEVIGMV